MLQEEFSAAEDDNEGDELWLSKSQNSTVYIEQAPFIMGELSGNISMHTVVNPRFGTAFVNVKTAFNNPIPFR